MKVLVIGSGGREHTIAWRLAQSNLISEVICVPGNGGTAVEAKCRNVDQKDNPELAKLSLNQVAVSVAKSEKVDFAVIGPEDPLADGIADALWNENRRIVCNRHLFCIELRPSGKSPLFRSRKLNLLHA